MIFNVFVSYADGDDYSRKFQTEVSVEADNERAAKLVAMQMVAATRCDVVHVQIIKVSIIPGTTKEVWG